MLTEFDVGIYILRLCASTYRALVKSTRREAARAMAKSRDSEIEQELGPTRVDMVFRIEHGDTQSTRGHPWANGSCRMNRSHQ